MCVQVYAAPKAVVFEPFGLNYRPEDIAVFWKLWDDNSTPNLKTMVTDLTDLPLCFVWERNRSVKVHR